MKWNTQRKVSVGILGLAVAAFGGDQILRSSGEESTLAENLVVKTSAREAAPVSVAKPAAAQSMSLLADRLEAVSVRDRLPVGRSADAFATPSVWLARAGKLQPVVEIQLETRADSFRAAHRLSGVLRKPARPADSMVVVDGRALKVGQVFDGFMLVSIHDRSARFTAGRETVDLYLPQPELTGGLTAAR